MARQEQIQKSSSLAHRHYRSVRLEAEIDNNPDAVPGSAELRDAIDAGVSETLKEIELVLAECALSNY